MMAATFNCVLKYLIFSCFLLASVIIIETVSSNNVKFVPRDLQHINQRHFQYLTRIVQQANSLTNILPRRPISAWHKHGHCCLLIQKKDISVDMDVERNPGPAIVSNWGFLGFVDVCIENFNSHFESSLSLSFHLQMRFTGYVNRQQLLVCFRDE